MDELGQYLIDGELVYLASLRILAGDLAAVAEHATARGAAARRLAAQATSGRTGGAHPLLLAYDALEGEYEVVDLARHHRVHRDLVQPEQFDHVMQMLGVTAEPVDILDDDVAYAAACDKLQGLLQAGAFHRRAGDAVVAMEGDDLQPAALGIALREQLLVVDR